MYSDTNLSHTDCLQSKMLVGRSVKKHPVLVNLLVKLSCEKGGREDTRSGNNSRVFWQKASHLLLLC